MRLCTALTAWNTSSLLSGAPLLARASSWASTLSRTSESLSVLVWRWSVSDSSSRSCLALVRLPLCTMTMPKGAFT